MVFHIFFVICCVLASVFFLGRGDEEGGSGSKHGEHGVASIRGEWEGGHGDEVTEYTRAGPKGMCQEPLCEWYGLVLGPASWMERQAVE